MSSGRPSVLSVLEKDSYKESYIRYLYKYGYPATPQLMKKFNKKFYDDHGLEGKERDCVVTLLNDFNCNLKRSKKIGLFHVVKRYPDIKDILSVVMVDCQQKKSDLAKLEDEKRSLKEKKRLLEEALREKELTSLVNEPIPQ